MPAVRARRPGRQSEQPTRGRRTSSSVQHMPRLATIKLEGGAFRDGPAVSGKSLMVGVTSILLFLGASIAGATWIGGSLFDARQAFEQAADAAAAHAGFAIHKVDVTGEGLAAARLAEVRALVVPQGAQSLLALDPEAVKARVESLDWVQAAQVRRMWPSTLHITVKRRQAFARWQEDGVISVIDHNGERLLAERAADHVNLPLVIGHGAGPAAEPLLDALERLPQVRAHTQTFTRVGDRRWNLQLASGTEILLPEQDPAHALDELEALQVRHRLLDRQVARLDMRVPGRLAVRIAPDVNNLALAGGV